MCANNSIAHGWSALLELDRPLVHSPDDLLLLNIPGLAASFHFPRPVSVRSVRLGKKTRKAYVWAAGSNVTHEGKCLVGGIWHVAHCAVDIDFTYFLRLSSFFFLTMLLHLPFGMVAYGTYNWFSGVIYLFGRNY